MPDLIVEVDRFREWAEGYPAGQRSGEWECNYHFWGGIYDAILEFAQTQPFDLWSPEEQEAVLYAIARDNEIEYLSGEIRRRHPELLLALAQEAILKGERDNRWQLAEELGHIADNPDAEKLLFILACDEDEYVRRRSLKSLACLDSPMVERLALEAWHRPDPDQQWTRMMVLDCLNMIGSPQLEPLLADAEKDEQKYLLEFAKNIRESRVV